MFAGLTNGVAFDPDSMSNCVMHSFRCNIDQSSISSKSFLIFEI